MNIILKSRKNIYRSSETSFDVRKRAKNRMMRTSPSIHWCGRKKPRRTVRTLGYGQTLNCGDMEANYAV